jgi:hypothetical protein
MMMAFNFIKVDLDRSNNNYEIRCEKNRINGIKGGRPRKNPNNPNGFSKTQITQMPPTKLNLTKLNLTNNNTYASLEFLKNIPLKEKELISKELGIGQDKVIKKARELYDWCIINGKKKKNYYLFLRVCLHKDFIEPKINPVRSESANYIKL